MTETRPKLRVAAEDLRALVESLLSGAGASTQNAKAAAEIFLEADLRGVNTQGIDYLPYTLKSLSRGLIDGTAEPRIVDESPGTALIDGRRGLGQPAALLAVELASGKAREVGTAAIAIKNSTDIFMIGAYADRMARNGLVGWVMTSGPPLVHPYGGTERMLSTNPIAIGIPRAEDPLVFDMSTSALSSARIRQAAYHNEHVPIGTGVGPDGEPTTDAATIRKGAIGPMAGHKGFGLALCVGLLCGPMTGSGIGPEMGGWQAEGDTQTQGHFFWAVDPARFRASEDFVAHGERYIDQIKSSRKAAGVDQIRIPGERSARTRRQQAEAGIEILEATWKIISEHAHELGVEMPEAVNRD